MEKKIEKMNYQKHRKEEVIIYNLRKKKSFGIEKISHNVDNKYLLVKVTIYF